YVENPDAWAGLNKIAVIARERHTVLTGKTTKETAYYIVSEATATAKNVLETTRNHWGIENRLHWVLDVSYAEDKQRVRDHNTAESLGILRRIAAGMIAQVTGERMSGHGLRQTCGWNPDVLLDVLRGKNVCTPTTRRRLDPKRPRVTPTGRFKAAVTKQ
ncbi:MAG: ISAs1 family transposase, partial [Myxococcales bacterium]|nr:ISAs1 family transposase [Myxococcales bacterium]